MGCLVCLLYSPALSFGQEAGAAAVPNHYVSTSESSQKIVWGAQALRAQLEAIHFDHIGFNNVPLSEVLTRLKSESSRRSPDHRGINFILNGELPGGSPASLWQELAGFPVCLSPALEDVRLLDVLNALVAASGHMLRYSIEDYAVVVRPQAPNEAPPLLSRVLKVDPNTFQQGLHGVVGVPFGASAQGTGGSGGANPSGVPFSVPQVDVVPSGSGGGIPSVTQAANSQSFGLQLAQAIGLMGFDVHSGNAVFAHDDGRVMLRGTQPALANVDAGLAALADKSAAVWLTATTVELPLAEAQAFLGLHGEATIGTKTMAPAQVEAQIANWRAESTVKLKGPSRLLGATGHASYIPLLGATIPSKTPGQVPPISMTWAALEQSAGAAAWLTLMPVRNADKSTLALKVPQFDSQIPAPGNQTLAFGPFPKYRTPQANEIVARVNSRDSTSSDSRALLLLVTLDSNL